MIPEHFRLKNTIKYPTSLIVGGLSKLGLEIVDSLLEQGGYVVIVDTYSEENLYKLEAFPKDALVSFIDFTTLPHLDEDLRRLDYVFYFNHESIGFTTKVSTQDFLRISNYLDATLSLASKFDAKFLLTTAIKAHQLVVDHDEIGVNYAAGVKERHRVYTEMELQRYAESLAMEYAEKINLDARIVRLGEIIGDAIDFSLKSPFNDLVLAAAQGDSLRLKKDGLETEWLVHTMDASYGIIKAQFSKNTKGQIFSVTYENSFTHLAIAYKIQEVEPNAQEIIFVEERDNLPSLKLYKPAPNLSIIGWVPRVTFEKAVKQSIAAAKIYLLENQSPRKILDSQNSLLGKLKGFLNLADNENSHPTFDENQYSGPVSRLIAERKRQEEIKKQSIELAANAIKVRRKRKPRTVQEKVVNWFWNRFLVIGNTFKFLKNKTPGEFGILIVSFVAFILIFFYIFSPWVAIFRDVAIAYPSYQQTLASVEQQKFNQIGTSAEEVKTSLASVSKTFGIYEGLFKAVGREQTYSVLQELLADYSFASDGVKNIAYALEPLYTYLDTYESNIQRRASKDSFLSVSKTKEDFGAVLQEFEDRQPYLRLGIEKLDKGLLKIKNLNIAPIPNLMEKYFAQINETLVALEADVKDLQALEYLPDLLGVNEERTYLFVLLDNTRLKPIGGELSAFALGTFSNGAITDITVQSPDSVDFDTKTINASVLQRLNNRKFTYVNSATVTEQDLSNLYTLPDYADALTTLFQDAYAKEIDGVITLNYSVLEKLLQNSGGVVELKGESFDTQNFLTSFNALQDSTVTLEAKHALSAELLAYSISSIFANFKTNFVETINLFTETLESQDLQVYFAAIDYSEFSIRKNFSGDLYMLSDGYFSIGVNTEDPRVVDPERYPNISTATEVFINQDFALDYKMTLKYPALGITQEISVCLPQSALRDTIKVAQVPTERYVINDSLNEKCIVVKSVGEKELTFEWKVPRSSTAVKNRVSLGMGEVLGATVTNDYKITWDEALKLTSSDRDYVQSEESIIITTHEKANQKIVLSLMPKITN